MIELKHSDIKILLTRWGQWSKTGADIAGTSYKTQPCFRLIQASGFGETANDDVMLLIDSAMAWLKGQKERDYLLLKHRYQTRFYSDDVYVRLLNRKKLGKQYTKKVLLAEIDLAEKMLVNYLNKNPVD